MKNFILSEQYRDVLVAYLSERPFKEVVQGIQTLNSLPELPDAPPAPPPQEEKKKE